MIFNECSKLSKSIILNKIEFIINIWQIVSVEVGRSCTHQLPVSRNEP
jgi:hypothetical protein